MSKLGDPRKLWRRYVLAVSLIVAMLAGSHLAMTSTLGAGAEEARVINLAGRQRMLSQRILFLGSHAMANESDKQPDLSSTIDLFENSHRALTQGGAMDLSRAGAAERQAVYRRLAPDTGSASLDRMVRDFIADARIVANGPASDAQAAWNRMLSVGPDTLLQGLNAAVSSFEDDAKTRNADMLTLAHLSFALAILILIAEGAFIFWPAQQIVSRNLADMEQTHGLLFDANRAAAANVKDAEAARARAEAAELAKDRFIGHMSHELRTPLNGLIGMLELIGDDPADRATADRIATARDAAAHLLAMCNDILDLSRINEGRVKIEPRPFDPTALGVGVVAIFERSAADKGIALSFEPDEDLPSAVLADDTRLRQIALNLVSNAIKFTETGAVTLSIGHADGRLSLQIRDTGPGIPEADRARLFGRFEQLDDTTTRRHDGVGLGLAISQKLAKRLGGDITIHHNPGGGTIFRATVSAPKVEPSQLTPRNPTEDQIDYPALSGLHVLVAEDNLVNQRIAAAFLSRLGVTLDIVGDGEAAVALARDHRFDAVLLDIHMPVLDGIGALRCIRDLPDACASVPVIAVTAATSTEDAARYRAAGFDGVLPKPLDRRTLAEAILGATGRRASCARPAA